jgi:hypothetical protein
MPNLILSHTRATLAASLMQVAIAGAAVAGPFEDGVAAYQRGDYATALQLLRPLAERGNAEAQQGGRRGLTKGLSWTIDQAKAEKFALGKSFHGPPLVASGWVFKRDVFAYFTRRDESEIVLSPDDLTVTKILPLLSP